MDIVMTTPVDPSTPAATGRRRCRVMPVNDGMSNSRERAMNVRHEMREALMTYAVKATGETREEIEKSMDEEDQRDFDDMVNVVTEVAERYAQGCVNKTATQLI